MSENRPKQAADIHKNGRLKTPAEMESSASPAGSIADRIVADLFVNVYGDIAQRLVLEGDNGSDLGGRNRDSVRSVIMIHLET